MHRDCAVRALVARSIALATITYINGDAVVQLPTSRIVIPRVEIECQLRGMLAARAARARGASDALLNNEFWL